MVGRSRDFFFFDSKNMNTTTNADVSKRIRGSSGDLTFTATTDNKLSVQLAPEKSLCFNPSVTLVGFQAFVAFNFPSLPDFVSTGITLVQSMGSNAIKTLVSFPNNAQQNFLLETDTTSSTNSNIKANTDYLLLIGVDPDISYIQSSIVDMKSNTVADLVNYLIDGDMVSAIFEDRFYICLTTTGTSSRSANAVNSTMNLLYFGSQNRTILVTNSTIAPRTTSPNNRLSGGAIAGITVGVVAFCVIVLVLTLLVIIMINNVYGKKKVPIKKQSPEVEMKNISV
ncbi:hypothetical protein AKO1_002320 [Acrasis kona]|uniref:Uncharacterized protein n=1 Tax=Acrasis kona TaxID=1008807 RepID=A0AAW2ZMU6_9EUKA